ncbi:MAG: carboxylase [Muribaculaceae bacterium]|nr:carboxylase [Muribaculaceae bacterium]
MESRKLKIRDLTMRDGQQSLFATRMSQQTIDRLLPLYENAGYYIMEVWGGAVPDSVMRYLGESPWDRLRKASAAMKGKSLLSALSRGRNLFGYVPYPDSVLEGFYKEAIANGLNVMRIFDALNDIDNVKESIRMINELGGIADGAVCYTVDPKEEAPAKSGFGAKLKSLFGGKPAAPEKIFTDEYFVNKAKEMEALGAKIITLKDMAGLVSPSRAASIISSLKRELKVPVDFHTHCTPGYGLASSVMAMIHGVDILDTNIWWFGGGTAAPAIELIYIFAQRLGIEVEVNMEAVGKIRNELLGARKELAAFDLVDELPIEFDPLNDTLPDEISRHFDEAISCGKAGDEEGMLEHCHAIEAYFRFPKPNELVKNAEVPGGMYSNMVAQLKTLKADDVLDEAMALIPKVRRDAGLVPLVTPTSQIVGSQAVVLALDRKKGNADYTNKSNQFISLVKGEYGHTPVAVDPEFRAQITGDAAEHPYDVSQYKKPENPTLDEFGGMKLASNNEEYLLLELLPAVATGFLRNKRAAEFAAAQAEAAKNAPVEEKVEEAPQEPITGEVLTGPMPGTILEVEVKTGDSVKKGQKLLVYESMKMENDVEAEKDAVVKRVFVKPGDRFAADAPLIEFQD